MQFFEGHLKKIGWAILCAAALLRLFGIQYGLPLWAVGDEPSSIFGALKMIELKTVIPRAHLDAFLGTLHYSPMLSYLYLFLFIPILSLQYLFFPGSFSFLLQEGRFDLTLFSHAATLDLSWVFVAARLVSVFAGVLTVWFVWKAGESLFRHANTGLFSAAFLALSLFHVNYSHWARHWVPATAFFAAVIYTLSRHDLSIQKRYTIAFIFTGIGMSINVQVVFGFLYALLWYVLVDKGALHRIWKEFWVWKAVAISFVPVLIAYAVWPAGFGYLSNTTPAREGYISISNWVGDFIEYGTKLLWAEPVFLLFFCIGCFVAGKQYRRELITILGCIFLFISALYIKGLSVDRGLLFVYPLMALCAGYGLSVVYEWLKRFRAASVFVVCIVLLALLIPSIRFDMLLARNDTRGLAREWMVQDMPRDARVLILAPLLDVPLTPQAISEQEVIDSTSLRSMDRASRAIGDQRLDIPRFHALHLHRVLGPYKQKTLKSFDVSGYDYFIVSSGFAEKEEYRAFVERVGGADVASFSGSFREDTLETSLEPFPDGFQRGISDLFRVSSFGPEIVIRKL